jgi:hypothetical protein
LGEIRFELREFIPRYLAPSITLVENIPGGAAA